MDCIFCAIAAKKMKAKVVGETDLLVVIEDINPQAPKHLLVIPKEHYETMLDCTDTALFAEMLEAAKDAARHAGIAENGFRTVINTNNDGGQTVFHLHMHVIGGRPLSGKMG